MISKLVIVGLILVWAIVLLPDVMSRLNRGRRGDPIRSFSSQLNSLGRSQGAGGSGARVPNSAVPTRGLSDSGLSGSGLSDSGLSGSGLSGSGIANRRANTRTNNVIDLRTRSRGTRAPQDASVDRPRAAPAAPRAHAVVRPVPPAVRKRRQDVLVTLGSFAVLTLLATVAFGSAFLYVHLLADVLLAAYLVLLARAGATQSVAAPATRRPRDPGLAPIGPLSALPAGAPAPPGAAVRTATVGSPRPIEPRRIAN